MNLFGHIYVNVSNVNCSRASVFHSSYPNTSDLKITLMTAPFFFFAGNIVAIRAPTDVPAGHSWEECFFYNMVYWLPGYMAGLQYTHLNQGFLKDFSISAEKMKNWGVKLWVFFTFVVCFNVGCCSYTVYLFVQIECGLFQAVLFLTVLGSIFGPIFVFWKTHTFHFHHYLAGMYAIPLLWFPHPLPTWLCGWASGVLVEGAARWGYDPLWIRNTPSESKTSEKDGPN